MPSPRPARPWLEPLRTAAWLSPERVAAWCTILLVTEVLITLFLALWQHGAFRPVPNPPSSDFVSFYAAGKLALAGTPALAYDRTAHWAAEQAATWAGAGYQYFFYPPVFLLLCAPLAALPYFVAYTLFQVATLAPFLLAMRAVLPARGWQWLAPVLAFPAVFWTVGLGQNAFLTAALFAGFTLLLDRRPVGAGVMLGLLSYKPHFGMLVPVALIAGGRRRAFAAAAATVAGLVALSLLLFGWSTWAAYLHAFAGSGEVYQSGAIDFAGIETPFGAARLLGVPPATAYALQATVTAAMMALTALVWRRSASYPMRCAVLPAATLLAVPLALLYDKLLLLLAIGWLLRAADDDGFLPWERLVLLVVWPASVASWPVGTAWHIPLGLAATVAVLALCLRRAWHASAIHPARAAPARTLTQTVGATP
ncbi:MAG TPA: glycosyltransferase family 87 protein [Acetobacteraceae bacterium]|nr:glycosyltransferase family 87 protein [Acetobacteraceae bacterium]